MPDFRLKAISANGKLIQTEFEATSKREAQKRVDKVAQGKGFETKAIEKKSTFTYKVQMGLQEPITGEQKAYNKDELEKALVKLGYKVININKKWFTWKGGVSNKEVVTFISLCADLLEQQLSFDEILRLLHEDTRNKRMKEVIKTIQQDLKEGKEGTEVYGKHKDVFGRFAAFMLGVASTSGNMSLVFRSTAKFLERDAEFKKNLRRSMLMPGIMFLAAIGVLLFYVGYIFPTMAAMFLEFNIKLPPMTAATLELSRWLQANWIILLLSFLIPLGSLIMYVRTSPGKMWLDRNIIKLPVIGDLMHKTSIEIFSRVFYTLYSGSGQNIEVLQIAA